MEVADGSTYEHILVRERFEPCSYSRYDGEDIFYTSGTLVQYNCSSKSGGKEIEIVVNHDEETGMTSMMVGDSIVMMPTTDDISKIVNLEVFGEENEDAARSNILEEYDCVARGRLKLACIPLS